MRCPFPDCPTQKSSAANDAPVRVEHVADDVYLCRACGRLAFKCVAGCKQALSRPFSRYCRTCGESQLPASGLTAINRWEEVQRFDFDWTFLKVSPKEHEGIHSHVDPTVQSYLYDLDKIKGFRSPKVLIEWTFVDGLLAIHQGGGFLALIHPFGDLVENPQLVSPVVWTRPEEGLVELPLASEDDADVFRPFTPMATADRKYVIFSTPYAVFAVQLGSLPGWHYRAETQASVVWTSTNEISLAAAPVLLNRLPTVSRRDSQQDNEPTPNEIGLLLFDSISQSYSWQVVGLDTDPLTAEDAREKTPGAIPLSISGHPVQILGFRDQCLVFATPVGHWLWSTEEARRGEVSTILRLSTTNDRSEIVLDAEVQNRPVFSWRCQHLLKRNEHERSGRPEKSLRRPFELCYMRLKSGSHTVEWRNVWPDNPEDTCSAMPQAIDFHDRTARPLGDSVSADDASAREMLFLVDSAGELYRRPITGDVPRPLGNIQTGQLTKIHGLRFHDPLLVVVRKDLSDESLWTVELRSLRYPDRRAIANGLALKADPLPWSKFLFTCEETVGGLSVIRREYSVGPFAPRLKAKSHVFESRKT